MPKVQNRLIMLLVTNKQVCNNAQGTKQVIECPETRAGTENVGAYIVKHDADEQVERYPEEVDDGGTALLWHILAAHLHHAWPEDANTGLKHTEGQQLDLAFKSDPCQHANRESQALDSLRCFVTDQREPVTA